MNCSELAPGILGNEVQGGKRSMYSVLASADNAAIPCQNPLRGTQTPTVLLPGDFKSYPSQHST